MNKNIEKLFDLKERVVIITGGAGMLGYQYAEILSDAGAHVVIVDIDQKMCDKTAKEITKRNKIEAIGVQTDISKEVEVKKMVEIVKKKFGRIDVLINNAVSKPEGFADRFENYDFDVWKKVVSVNLDAIFLCSKIVCNEMVKQGSGVVINIGSVYGMVGTDQRIYGEYNVRAPAVYSACKGGVINLTRYLATYFGDKGIRVNCLSPGGVENKQAPEFIRKYSEKTPMARMVKREELKGPILFLASDASSYMTGANLVVDGGWTAW